MYLFECAKCGRQVGSISESTVVLCSCGKGKMGYKGPYTMRTNKKGGKKIK